MSRHSTQQGSFRREMPVGLPAGRTIAADAIGCTQSQPEQALVALVRALARASAAELFNGTSSGMAQRRERT